MSETPSLEHYISSLKTSFSTLPDKPEETADGTVRALWHLASGNALSIELAADKDLPVLDPSQHECLAEFIERRQSGIPLAHITERQRFMEMELLAGPGALIPRKETEILGRAALGVLREMLGEREHARVIDVCTGTGNLALAFAHHEPRCTVYGADLSVEAVALARLNAEHCGLSARAEFRDGDLLEPFAEMEGQVDLLTCNPPYISSQRVEEMPDEISHHEPRLAFDGGPFGVKILTKLVKRAPKLLKPRSWLCFEMGLGQGEAMAKRLGGSKHFGEVRSFEDQAGQVRAVAARTV